MKKGFSFAMIFTLILNLVSPINTFAQKSEPIRPIYSISLEANEDNNYSVTEYVYSSNATYLTQPKLEYDEVYNFYNGMATVCKDNKYGVIDEFGNELISPIYDYVYSTDTSGIVVKIDNKFKLLNTKGVSLSTFNYDYMTGFSGNLAAAKKDNKWGVINKNDRIVIPFIYDDIKPFYSDVDLIAVQKNGNWGVINKDGEQIIDFKYQDINQYLSESTIFVKEDDRWGCLNSKGNKIIDSIYLEICTYSDGLAAVKNEYGKWGFINTSGDVVIDFLYDDISRINTYGKKDIHVFSNGLAGVRKAEKWGFINTSGDVVIDFLYDAAIVSIFENALLVRDDLGAYGFINRKGNKLTDFVFGTGDYVFSETEIILPRLIRNTLVDSGIEIIPPWPESNSSKIRNNLTIKYGCLDKNLREVIPFIYDNCFALLDEASTVKLNDKWGIIKDPIQRKEIKVDKPSNKTSGGKKDKTPIQIIEPEKKETITVESVKNDIISSTNAQKSSVDHVDRLIRKSEEAIKRATTIEVKSDDLVITKDLVDSVKSESEKLKGEITKVFEDNSIELPRKINTNVMIDSKSSRKTKIKFDKSVQNTTIDNVSVKTDFTEVTVDRSKLNSTVEVTLSEVSSKLNVNFVTDATTVLKVSLPKLDGNVDYMAVRDDDGNLVGGKYNPVTEVMEAKINRSGLFEVIYNEKDFEDIKDKSAQMQEAIRILASKGIINGTAEFEFSPDTSISRAEVASIILSITSKLDPNTDGKFIDVTRSNWYFGVAGSSKKYGLISGYPDNTFRGENIIPKEQIISLAARTLKTEMEYTTPADIEQYLKYVDRQDISKWAEQDVALATMANLVTKRTDNKFNPNSEMTRGDAAIILKHLFDKIW